MQSAIIPDRARHLQGHPDLGLILRCLVIVFFYSCRGLMMSQDLSEGEGYSIATFGLYVGLAALALPRFFGRNSLCWPAVATYLLILTSWFGVAAVCTYGTSYRYDPGPLIVEYVGAVVLTILIFVNFRTCRELEGLMKSLVLAGIFTSVWAIVDYVTGGTDAHRFGALGATGATYNTVGYMLAGAAMAGPVATTLFDVGRRAVSAYCYRMGMLGMFLCGILLTGTRGGVVAFAVAVILSFIILKRKATRKSFHTILLAVMLISCSFGLAQSNAVLRIFTDKGDYRSASEYMQYARGEMFLHATSEVFSDPRTCLVGVGVGQYRYDDGIGEYKYPHNLFLDLAVNAGIPAAAIMAVLLWQTLKSLVVMIRESRSAQLRFLAFQVLGVGVVSVVGGLVCFQFTSNLQLWMLIGAWGSMESLRVGDGRKRDPSKSISVCTSV